MEWISVNERLPEQGKRVILFYNERYVDFGYLESSDYNSKRQENGTYKEYRNHHWNLGLDGENKGFGFSDFRVTYWCEIVLPTPTNKQH